MRKWLAISGAGAIVGYVAVYFALDRTPVPEPEPEQPAATTAAPVVLGHVVEVTDLDPLLDPPPEVSTGGVPFEASEPLELSAPAGAPVPIPLAVEEPVGLQGAAPPVDGSRAVWYGAGRLPRQISERPTALVGNSGPYYCPAGFTVGIGYFF